MSHPLQGNLVEGLSDEVVIVITGLLGACLASIIFQLYKFRLGRRVDVHPLQEQVVEQTRSSLSNSGDHSGNNRNNDRPRVSYNADSRCPICILDPRAPVETNCGHIFCAECLITYWKHGSWHGPMNCPICRQQVTILLYNFENDEGNDFMVDLTTYNRRYSGEPRSLWDYIRDFPTLLRHFLWECSTIDGIAAVFRIKIALGILIGVIYVFLPLDIIPEAVFGILGLLDDVFVIFIVLIYVTIVYRNVIVNR